jgi:integrase
MPYSAVQKDYYIFAVSGIYYAQFRDPMTRELLSKKSSGLRNRTMADKWAKKEYDRLCIESGKTGFTLREYADLFYKAGCPHGADRKANGNTFGIQTSKDNRFRLTEYILPDPICDKILSDVTRPDSLNFRDRLIKKLGYTRKAQLTLIAYRNIINTAINHGLINSDPAAKVTIKLKNKGERAATSIDNIKKILSKKYWPNETIWLAAITAGIAGLRSGELSGLRWQDIDLKNEKIKIIHSVSKYEGEKTTKSGKPRIAPYPKILQTMLEPHRGKLESYVFSIKNSEPLAYDALRSAMRKAMNKAAKDIVTENKKKSGDDTEITDEELKNGITKISLHGLRHSINTALLEAGVNPELLRASFGWTDPKTQEIYTHRDLYNLTPQSEAVDKLFNNFIGE